MYGIPRHSLMASVGSSRKPRALGKHGTPFHAKVPPGQYDDYLIILGFLGYHHIPQTFNFHQSAEPAVR